VTILLASVAVMGITTIAYTYLGGMSAVIWTDVIQLVIYLVGAGVAACILLDRIPGGWSEVGRVGAAGGKFTIFDFTVSVTKSTRSGPASSAARSDDRDARHGPADGQRYICSTSARQARVALLTSGAVVFAQFVLFLRSVDARIPPGTRRPGWRRSPGRLHPERPDLPHFIVTHLPPGVVGLVVAAVFAADVHAFVIAELVVRHRDVDLHAGAPGERRALPARLAVADGVLGCRRSRWRSSIQFSTRVVDEVPGRLVHERHHPRRRSPGRVCRAAVAAFAGIVAGDGDAGRQAAQLASWRGADQVRGDMTGVVEPTIGDE
jgi:hypothetical protein